MSLRESQALTAPMINDSEAITNTNHGLRWSPDSTMEGSALIVWTFLEYQRLDVTDPRPHRERPRHDRASQVGACAAVAVSAQRFADEVQPLAAPPESSAGSAFYGCGAVENGGFGLATMPRFECSARKVRELFLLQTRCTGDAFGGDPGRVE